MVVNGMIYYEHKTGPGQGGSPIFLKSERSGRFYAAGVHLGKEGEVKFATKITKSRLDEIKALISDRNQKTLPKCNRAENSMINRIVNIPVQR